MPEKTNQQSYHMKKKIIYDAPNAELVDVNVEKGILIDSVGSVDAMNTVNGTWDADDDY